MLYLKFVFFNISLTFSRIFFYWQAKFSLHCSQHALAVRNSPRFDSLSHFSSQRAPLSYIAASMLQLYETRHILTPIKKNLISYSVKPVFSIPYFYKNATFVVPETSFYYRRLQVPLQPPCYAFISVPFSLLIS